MSTSRVEFDLQPTLTGARVQIRPIEASDWDAMFVAASDEKIWEQHPESSRYQAAVFRSYFDGALECGSGFAFVDRATGKVIGSSRYHGYDADRSEVEIGWTFLTREYWGGSYNLEIKRLMLDHAFRFVDTVIFRVGENNLRSRRAMEKIGGVLRDDTAATPENEYDSNVVYEITRRSWIAFSAPPRQ